MNFKNKTILLTGGTGSFGNCFTEILLREHEPKKIIIFSRDELKQYDMRIKFNNDPRLRFFLGDVRDKERLYRAMQGVDIVIHAAALKQVPALEYNPFEAVRTNIIGGYNVVTAACDSGVSHVIALSTDKAANPVNLYGATKLCSDKIFVSGNNFGHISKTKLAVVRYGNVAGSRGSVLPLFYKLKETGKMTITDDRMTRFWITLEQAARFVTHCLSIMGGGEIFIPKIPSMRVIDLATAIAPECEQIITGIRPGEKLHEVMVPEEEARNTLEFSKFFVICPQFHEWSRQLKIKDKTDTGKECPDGFSYSSDNNDWWLSVRDLRDMYANQQTAYETNRNTDSIWQATDR
ncbi:MAG: UDP-N-acetylglucosamine 4,6-dehydratase (inverting) [Deltaproteobacteria bacterium]|nr:UDP-N-acetylglucosamine 4,6-dehydratase (inverting) [Deltaproteobacteria bacterium]